MICPNCKADLAGELIYDAMLAQCGGDEPKAAERSAYYGATKENGKRFGREIALYNLHTDMTYAYRCPDCKHEWPR